MNADQNVRYQLHAEPFVQGPKLIGRGAIGSAYGESAALSADGSTALVGGPNQDHGLGAAWVFTRSGSAWRQQTELVSSAPTHDAAFGDSVALSADGETAVVGAPGEHGSLGAAYVFVRTRSQWMQQATLVGGNESGAGHFGYSVAISSNGDIVLVGGPDDRFLYGYQGADGYGAAWVFTRSGTSWQQDRGKLTGLNDPANGDLGFVVALSADGHTALVGAFNAGNGDGAAWIFARSASGWKQQAELTGRGQTGANGEFGAAVALSGNGDTALIGCPGNDFEIGGVWVYSRRQGKWSQQGPFLTGQGEIPYAGFGINIAVSGSGHTAVIGGYQDNNNRGAAWILTRTSTGWNQEKLTNSDTTDPSSHFGGTVALSASGSTALIVALNGTRSWVWVFQQAR
jgi:hypothetical protein